MAALAERSRATPASAAAGRPRSRRRARPRSTAGGVAWIVLAGVLLAGVVALNVAVLQLNLSLDRAGRERGRLRAENAQLASQVSTAAAAGRIADRARARGLRPVDPDAITYVDLRTPARGR